MKGTKGLGILILLLIVAGITPINTSKVSGDQNFAVFSTWEGFEVDKYASIWLIKRFVDEHAVIRFYPKGSNIDQGIPFDTPEAKFRRYFNMSTFESLLHHYKINDPGLVYIGKIIHDIEVNVWEKKVMEESLTVQDKVNSIIWNTTGNKEIIEKSAVFFDSLYEKISQKNERINTGWTQRKEVQATAR